MLVDQVSHMFEELLEALAWLSCGELAVVEGSSNPHVVHEQWEPNHHSCNTERASKIEVSRVVNLGIQARCPSVNNLGFCGSSRAIGISIDVPIGVGTICLSIGVSIRLRGSSCFLS